MTQLELPVALVQHGLQLARSLGIETILNPAPAMPLAEFVYPICDFITPNETEAALLTGVDVQTVDDTQRVADSLSARGVVKKYWRCPPCSSAS